MVLEAGIEPTMTSSQPAGLPLTLLQCSRSLARAVLSLDIRPITNEIVVVLYLVPYGHELRNGALGRESNPLSDQPECYIP